MRRLIVTALIVILLVVCFPLSAISSTNCGIELFSSQVVDGYIDVAVSIKNNPGFTSFLLKVNFDNKKLTPYSVRRGAILPFSGTFSNNLLGDLSELTYVQTYFINTPSFSNISDDDVLYTIRFEIKEHTIGSGVLFNLDSDSQIVEGNEADISYTPDTEQFFTSEGQVGLIMTDDDLSFSNGAWSGNVKCMILERSNKEPIVQEDSAIIVVAYDSSDKLVYVRMETPRSLSVTPGVPFFISDITIPANEGQPLELKLFLWNSISQMEPLAENDVRIIHVTK